MYGGVRWMTVVNEVIFVSVCTKMSSTIRNLTYTYTFQYYESLVRVLVCEVEAKYYHMDI